jgi:hypothetical protein
MPGSVSSCSTVAVFRSTGPVDADASPLPEAGPAAVGEGRRPTHSCSPSTSTRARLSDVVATPGRRPAARSASTTREPAGRRTMPGLRTLPSTSTTTWATDDVAPADGVAGPDVGDAETGPELAGIDVVTWIGAPRGRLSSHHEPASSTATANNSARPRRFDGRQRTSSPAPTVVAGDVSTSKASGDGAGTDEVGSPASSIPSRRRARSARRLRLLGTAAR